MLVSVFHLSLLLTLPSFFFFFNDTATTEIYTLPYTTLFRSAAARRDRGDRRARRGVPGLRGPDRDPAARAGDRKSTRLNSSHLVISYAVFCLKKKKKNIKNIDIRIQTKHE